MTMHFQASDFCEKLYNVESLKLHEDITEYSDFKISKLKT